MSVRAYERFTKRNVLPFKPGTIQRGIPNALVQTIEVEPEVECLVQRIVMHASIAKRLVLVQILAGDTPKTPSGSGSCEIFMYDIPNWTPDEIIISPKNPLIILVRNWDDRPYKIVGSVVVLQEE